MSQLYTRPVIAAFDTSPNAAAALEMAATEASASGVELLVIHAYPWPVLYASLANVPYSAKEWTPAPETVRLVEAATAKVRARYPDLPVHVSVRAGAGSDVLVTASADASLVVLGARGSGGLAGVLTGSVLAGVAAHARCPVLVARGPCGAPPVAGEVCVGVDGSPSSLGALRFAATWAAERRTSVRALYAVGMDALDEPAPELGLHTPAEARLMAWIEECELAHLGVQVTAVVVHRSPTDALLAASGTGRLLVVGSRHRGELRSIALGSVGHALVRRSTCPVVVVHGWSDNSTPAHTELVVPAAD
jgi:nucleotide-binding universal stress UspA family protein